MRTYRTLVAAASVAATASLALLTAASPALAQESLAPLTPAALRTALANRRTNNDSLAGQIRAAFGEAKLKSGARPKTDNTPEGLTVAWAIEAPGLTKNDVPQVVTDDPNLPSLPLQRVGKTDIYAGTAFLPKGLAGHWSYVIDGKTQGTGQYEDYPINPEERPQPGVPQGKLTQMPPWRSKVFAGTSRDWWVYVPAQYSPDKPPPALMVLQDGGGPKNWVPAILDNMTAKGEIPPTVAVFINPGKFDDGRSNRSVEYDTLSDAYARFLVEEILPEVTKMARFSENPDDHLIYGVSSGGICAFTVAWERPDAFRKVDTCVGSFTNLQGGPTGVAGGNTYPAIIRHAAGWKHEGQPKPIKMFQTDGANDLDNGAGNWPLANQAIAKALDYGGYSHKFVFGNGFHGDRFGRYMMPEALRWLWAKNDTLPTATK